MIHAILLSHDTRGVLEKDSEWPRFFLSVDNVGSLGHTCNALVAWHQKLAWERVLAAVVLSVDIVG